MTKNDTPAGPERPASLDETLTAASNAIDLARARAEDAIAGAAGTEIELRADNALETKRRLAAGFSTITHAANDARAAAKSAELEAKRIIDEAQAILRAKLAELEPMLAHAKRLEDGIDAVNLYLGRDEYLETLREGEPAAPGTPLIIRQQVLAMDEESALFAEDGGMDFKHIGNFIAWMLADEQNLDQVIPDQLGIISIMPRRTSKDYGNIFENAAKNAANHESWWIIRNGEQLYLHTTDFSVGSRLVPLRDEFTKMFERRGSDGTTRALTPGSREWLAAEKAADVGTRHYMKIALILQGLIDRTTVFHPLPVEGLSLLTQDHYEAGHVRIIADDELALGTGRIPFAEFQKQAIAGAEVGMRVIGFFGGYSRDETSRVTPRNASFPESLTPHTISRASGDDFFFTYQRTDNVFSRDRWGRSDYAPAKTRATYRLDRASWGQPSWIPIDGLSAADLRAYLASRSERHAYVSMFPVLKAAIAFLEQETAEEKPFRSLLAAALAAAGQVSADDADAYAGELILWWKTKNRWHRALNGDGEHERKAQSAILTEAARRASGVDTEAAIAAKILEAHPDAMVVARRTSDWVAILPQVRRHPGEANLFVTVAEFTGTGRPRKSTEWKTLTHTQVAKWSILHQTEAWKTWKIGADTKRYLTDSQIDTFLEEALRLVRESGRIPVNTAYADAAGDSDRATPKFRVATSSAFDPDANTLSQGRITFWVAAGASGLELRGPSDRGMLRFMSDSWSHKHSFDDRSVRGPEQPSDVNYSGMVHPSRRVWVDEQAAAAEAALGAIWFDEMTRRRALSNLGQERYTKFCEDWERRNEAKVYARFLDDFGDPSLWDGHRKALRTLGWPHNSTSNPATQYDSAVRAAGSAAAARPDLGAGMSVAEIIAEHSIAVDVDIPEDVLEIRLPAAA